MQLSHSRVECFKKCPHQYYLRYIEKLRTVQNQDSSNALYLGTAMHEGIEKGLKAALKSYKDNYYVLTDENINEMMKLEYLIPKVTEMLPEGKFEQKIETEDFIGYVDLISEDGDIYDFKYSNAIDRYLDSPQLSIYKYFYELTTGENVRDLYYVFIPKVSIRQKYKNKTNSRDETLYEFRKRINENLKESEIKIIKVDYKPEQVIEFLLNAKRMTETKDYTKNSSYLCNWCEYKDYCERGYEYMLLPVNERRVKKIDKNPDFWIYADSYVGKSTFVDKFDDLLFINTDGNIDNTTSPVIRIADEVTQEGRIIKRKYAWEVFLDVLTELEKKDNDFKRIAIDLIEDLYEHCRVYIYDREGWTHESDGSFGKGWDMITSEFLNNFKRLKNLGYQVIYISKEIVKEINLKSGAKITTYSPNVRDKIANVLAGTVDLTVRAFMDNKGRFIQLSKIENTFGGGRFNFKVDEINLDYDDFMTALEEAQSEVVTEEIVKPKRSRAVKKEEVEVENETEEEIEEEKTEDVISTEEDEAEKTPGKRTRKKRTEENEEVEESVEEEKPKRTRRTRRAE